MNNPFFCWHSWGKWSSPVNGIMERTKYDAYYATVQYRECSKCGMAQFRKIPAMRHVDDLKKEVK